MGKKERFAFYLTPEKKAILERRFQEDGSRSMTAFVVEAGTTVKAALFAGGKPAGSIAELYVDACHDVENYYTYLETPEVYASTNR